MDLVDPRVFATLEDIMRLLNDPSREVPHVCVMVLLGLLNQGMSVCTKTQSNNVERRLERFRTCVYRWICAPRSPLWARVFSWACTGPGCPTQAMPMHQLGIAVLAEVCLKTPACLVLLHLFAGIKRSLQGLVEGTSKMKLNRITRRPAWPNSIEQILPYGDATMLGLLGWLEADWKAAASEMLVETIHTLVRMTRPMTLHHLLDSPTFIPKGIIPLLQSAFDFLLGRKRPGPLDLIREEQAFQRLDTAHWVMVNLMLWYIGPRQRRTFTGPWATPLLAVYYRAHALCTTLCTRYGRGHPRYEQLDSYVYGFLELGCALLHDFPELRAILPHAQVQVFPAVVPTSWEWMLRLLARLELAQQCAAPDCTRTYAEPLTFRYCSACKRVAYCSRQCQRRAWAHPAAPHRRVCQALRKVCAIAELPRKGARLLFEWGEVGPQDVPDELVRFIIEHFDAQDQYETEQRRMGEDTGGRRNVPRPSAE